MLERKCSWKFKIQFLVPKKIKIKEQTLNYNYLNVVPATNIIKNPKKKKKKRKIKTLLKKNGKLHERKKPNLTLHHLQISNPEKLAYIFS